MTEEQPRGWLAELVRQVAEETELVDPHDLARKVIEVLPDERGALEVTLPRYIYDCQRTERRSSAASARSGWGNRSRFDPATALNRWRSSIDVGEDGEHKRIDDFTRTELLYAAQVRRALAAETLRTAELYEAIAELLPKKGDKRVRDIPDDKLGDIFRQFGDES